MSTPLNPPAPSAGPAAPPPFPPAGPQPEPPTDPQNPQPSAAARVVAILAIVFGAVVILGGVGSAVVSTVAAANVRTSSQSIGAIGADALSADVSAGSLTVEFSDVSEAELDVTSSWGLGDWTLERDGDTIVVASPRMGFGGGWWFGGSGDAVLRLPASLEGADADLTLGAGSISADGAFGTVVLDVGAGSAEVSGSADDLTVDLSAGSAQLDVDSVDAADLTVSAGSLRGELTGSQPDDLVLDVSAGSMRLTIPDGRYEISADVSAGEFDNQVGSTDGAASTIDVSVSAGELVLRSR